MMRSHLQAALTCSGMGCTGTPEQIDREGRQGGSEQHIKDKAHITLYTQWVTNVSLEEALLCWDAGGILSSQISTKLLSFSSGNPANVLHLLFSTCGLCHVTVNGDRIFCPSSLMEEVKEGGVGCAGEKGTPEDVRRKWLHISSKGNLIKMMVFGCSPKRWHFMVGEELGVTAMEIQPS